MSAVPRITGVLVVLMAMVGSVACAPGAGGKTPPAAPVGVSIPGPPPGAQTDLASVLEPIRARSGLPGLAAAVISGDRVAAIGAVGVRKSGDPTPVAPGDAWHLGSDTKAMTATLFALYVDEGKIAFTTTLAQAFPAWASKMDPAYRDVTMQALLAHRGGLAHDVPSDVFANLPPAGGESRAARLAAIQAALQRPPEIPPDTRYSYSNAGYMILGAALEELTDTPWESLMRARLFEPLRMTTCGFGPPAAPGQVNQPWPHRVVDGELEPMPTGPGADNPPALGPAGTVHCSLADWGKFVAMHLAGARGESKFLSAASFAKLHTPYPGEEYAGGWLVTERPWSHGVALMHKGSNTMWFANVWLAPGLDRAFLVVTNRGDAAAAQATDEVVRKLVMMSSSWTT
jgi:CubicO group peptidase (beta-lactamase class C family)